MINEIQINPPVATYHNPTRLSDLRRINYIFGANGTGKASIHKQAVFERRITRGSSGL